MDARSIAEQIVDNVTVSSLAIDLMPGLGLPAEFRSVMLKRKLEVLQRKPLLYQQKMHSAFAAFELPSVISGFRENPGPNNAWMTMLNVISYTPYFVRFQRTPAGSGLAALQANRVATIPASTDLDIDDIGETTQFLATLMLLQGTSEITVDDKQALLQKLSQWESLYKGTGTMAENTIERCTALLNSDTGIPDAFQPVKAQLESAIEQCGVQDCPRRRQDGGSDLLQCSRCKTSVYCGVEHQTQAWASHKSTCFSPVF